MKNILVPVGTAATAGPTLVYALQMAQDFGATVYVADAEPQSVNPTHIGNIKSLLHKKSDDRIKQLIAEVNTSIAPVKLVEQTGKELVEMVRQLDVQIGLDLIVVSPYSNNINDEVFLGTVSGSMIKKTSIPVWVAPIASEYKTPKRFLLAFKRAAVANATTLAPLKKMVKQYDAKVNALLVKTPDSNSKDWEVGPKMKSLDAPLTTTTNATVYQGVLEHFQATAPDVLCVFKRKRGFFEKLWEPNVVLKKDFYCSIPLLVLKSE
jgi:nucleotide-binding universal stress UspA family protein